VSLSAIVFFFFSSRRRHTRCLSDWSSDVCSSDLVGAISTLAPFMLPKLIERCRSRFPNLQVNIREDFKTTLLREMLEGELDLALVARPVTDPNIHVELLCKESLMLVVQKGHPL